MKKTVFSGVQPSGELHLGNYLGAIKNWVDNQDLYNNIFCVVDLHSLTQYQHPDILKSNIINTVMLYLSCGIKPDYSKIFIQSDIKAHSELAWILMANTPIGWLERMTQYKDHLSKNKSISSGLLMYPVLMAADILLYDTDYVPVGEDQNQHVQLTRDISDKMNSLFNSNIFKYPEAIITGSSKIMSLKDPTKKMSKSNGDIIGILEDNDSILRKVLRAKTDALSNIKFNSSQEGIYNLLNIYKALTNKSELEIELEFEYCDYGKFKYIVADTIINTFNPIKAQYEYYSNHKDYVYSLLKEDVLILNDIANNKITEIRKVIGNDSIWNN